MHVKVDGMEVFALMGDDVIGVAVGEQQVAELNDFLAAKSNEDGTFLSVSYDMARQMELQAAMSGKLDYDSSNHHAEMNELVDALRTSYTEMLGRSRLDMRFSGDGLVIDSRMTFK